MIVACCRSRPFARRRALSVCPIRFPISLIDQQVTFIYNPRTSRLRAGFLSGETLGA